MSDPKTRPARTDIVKRLVLVHSDAAGWRGPKPQLLQEEVDQAIDAYCEANGLCFRAERHWYRVRSLRYESRRDVERMLARYAVFGDLGH